MSVLLFSFLLVQSPSIQAAPPLVEKLIDALHRRGQAPKTNQDPTIETLAANIDWLEHQIDRWGTVVAKSPDVWGEARLTKYRAEVEQQLADRVGRFDENRISGASSVRDQALLAAAISIGSGGQQAQDISTVFGDVLKLSVNDQSIPDAADFGLSGDNKLFADTIKLEQVQVLDQHQRYLDHLNELRRINEGDDTSDAPGYSLNLIRIPVSVLPGSKSLRGFGAEITFTATPELDPELLPTTFRDLVINDIVDQLALPMTRFLNSDPEKVDDLLRAFEAKENPDSIIRRINANIEFTRLVTNRPRICQTVQRILLENDIALSHRSPLIIDSSEIRFSGEVTRENLNDFLDDLRIISTVTSELAETSELLVQTMNSPVVETAAVVQEIGPLVYLSDPAIPKATPNQGPFVPPSPGRQPASLGNPDKPDSSPPASLRLPESIKREFRKTFRMMPLPLSRNTVSPDQFENSLQESPDLFEGLLESGLSSVKEGVHSIAVVQHQEFLEAVDLPWTAQDYIEMARECLEADEEIKKISEDLKEIQDVSQDLRKSLGALLPHVNLPASLTRRSTLPFPPSQLIEVIGLDNLGHLAIKSHQAFRSDIINRQVVHLTDVQAFLREEINAAYELLCDESMQSLWQTEVAGEGNLEHLVRTHQKEALEDSRNQFLASIGPQAFHRPIGTLAWAVYVDVAQRASNRRHAALFD